ncbi:flagellar basal body P-ring formation protein FlgA [bacterium]|nr:flagellar basal body P-ring formation protein FlgA [bacterium]
MKKIRLLIIAFILLNTGLAVSGVQQKINASVRKFVRMRADADSVSVYVQNIQPDRVRNGSKNITIEWKRGANDLKGRVVVPVRIHYSDNTSDLIYVHAEISLFCMVPVAAGNISRYSTINNSNLRLELRDVTSLRAEPAELQELVSGVRTKRLITKGRIITRDMIEQVPVIRRGERVKVVVDCRNLHVSTYAIAKEDGWPGKRIRIRTEGSRRELYAEVAGPAVVRITL